jgi:diguanylate cyclase (GGDEF)-like protein
VAVWSLWTLPVRARGYALTVEIVAGLTVLIAWFVQVPTVGRDLTVATVLLGSAMLSLEGSLHVERRRERYADAPYRDLANTWTFAAALLLPPGWVAAVVIGNYAWVWVRVRRYQPYRWFVSVSCMTLGTVAAAVTYRMLTGGSLAADRPLGLIGLAAAAVPMLTISPLLLAGAIRLAVPGTSWRQAIGSRQDTAMEAATCCLAVFVALASTQQLVLPVLAVPVLFLLSYTLLVSQLQKAATTDAKTGLSNVGGWHELAERELERAARRAEPLALLLLDLDQFKLVNDTHGHLAGDAVLRAVARALREEVRSHDLVEVIGRWGGEEFVALLPATQPDDAGRIAERLRVRIAGLCTVHPDRPDTTIAVTASIGVATYPDPAGDLGALLTLADAALYRAKKAGRDQVMAAQGPDLGTTPTSAAGLP